MQAMFEKYKKQLNKTAEDSKTGTSNAFQVEVKRLGSSKDWLLKVQEKWSKKKVESIKEELVELRNLIDELLERKNK